MECSFGVLFTTGRQYYRFGYLKDTIENTYLRDELITTSNDPLANPHDRLQLQEDAVVKDENDLDFENPDDNENDRKLQCRLDDVYYFVIDKKVRSAVTCLLWYLRLRQAFQKYKIQVFGGRSVILVGNFGQLPPVLDEPMYSQVLRFDSLSNDAMSVYYQFCKVYYLGVVQLQSGDSEEQEISYCECVMVTRLKISLNSPVARTNAVHTVHTGGNDARKADSDVAKGLYLLLSRSLKVMFTAQVNLWADIGLVNSSYLQVAALWSKEKYGFINFFGIVVLVGCGRKSMSRVTSLGTSTCIGVSGNAAYLKNIIKLMPFVIK
ncbi:hypothetical protein RhiirA5_372836 [Rhizophagus irregularis]|uniref:Uncharacterized protein n=1 Tax=Rhizophagus irregularis TaxID=588596 RepID=A0A2I1ED76_9GLOM|nr:hypothetical protein RhiirA5_372836 [Rhizophagus irregularis]PKY20070.1 hypothetical protein RhiirB3_496653 [Rhizophagus irregularis]